MFCQNWRLKIKRPRAWNMSVIEAHIVCFNPRPVKGATPMISSGMTAEPVSESRWNFALLMGYPLRNFSKENWPGQVRPRSYDVIRGTASDPNFNETFFSVTWLLAIDSNKNIMWHLDQKMSTFNVWHCTLTFRRSPEINDLGWRHTYL